jgi:hypothetical protein
MTFEAGVSGFVAFLLSVWGPAVGTRPHAGHEAVKVPETLRIRTTFTPTREDGTPGDPIPVVVEVDGRRGERVIAQLSAGLQHGLARTQTITREQAARMLEKLEGLEKQVAGLQGMVPPAVPPEDGGVITASGFEMPAEAAGTRYERLPAEAPAPLSWIWDIEGGGLLGRQPSPVRGVSSWPRVDPPPDPERVGKDVQQEILLQDLLRTLNTLLKQRGITGPVLGQTESAPPPTTGFWR